MGKNDICSRQVRVRQNSSVKRPNKCTKIVENSKLESADEGSMNINMDMRPTRFAGIRTVRKLPNDKKDSKL